MWASIAAMVAPGSEAQRAPDAAAANWSSALRAAIQRFALSGAGALAFAVAAATALLWTLDVPPRQTLAYLGYEAAFVWVPGVVACVALRRGRRIGLRDAAVGWGVGFALVVAAAAATGAAGARWSFLLYPPAVVVAAALALRRRLRPLLAEAGRGALRPSPSAWLVVALGSIPIGFLANNLLAAPLPDRIWSITGYPRDQLWTTALTAEAASHWPLTIPNLAGLPLHYHYFVFLDMGAASRVADVTPWLVNFRLFPVFGLGLAVFLLYAAGRVLGRSAAAGLLAIFLVLLIDTFSPWPQPDGQMMLALWGSLSFLYGILVFLPLALHLDRLLLRRTLPGEWLVLGLLAAVAAGAKAPILPIVGLGLLVPAAAAAVSRHHDALARIAGAGALVAVVFGLGVIALYGGVSDVSTRLAPLEALRTTEPYELLTAKLPGIAAATALVAVAAAVALKAVAALVPGIAIALWRRRPASRLFLLGMLLAGLGFYLTYRNPGDSQLFFLWYGYIAAAVLAAVGLATLVPRLPALSARQTGSVVVALVVLLALWTIELPFDRAQKPYWQNINLAAREPPDPSYAGYEWLAENLPRTAVVAIVPPVDPDSCYQAAFARRHVLIGCALGLLPGKSETSPEAVRAMLQPAAARDFSRRQALNEAIFRDADPAALEAARAEYGVEYLVVDPVGDTRDVSIERLASIATVVYEDRGFSVLAVRTDERASS